MAGAVRSAEPRRSVVSRTSSTSSAAHVYDMAGPTRGPPRELSAESDAESVHVYDMAGPVRGDSRQSVHVYDMAGPVRGDSRRSVHEYDMAGPGRDRTEARRGSASASSDDESVHEYVISQRPFLTISLFCLML